MAFIVRSGTVWEISRRVGSRSESFKMLVEDMACSSFGRGSERVEEKPEVEGLAWVCRLCEVRGRVLCLDEGRTRLGSWRVRLPASVWRSWSMRGTVNAKFPPALKPESAIR